MRNCHLDHIVPLEGFETATNGMMNLQILCQHCNTSKSDIDAYARPAEQIFHMIPDRRASVEVKNILAAAQRPKWCDLYKERPRNELGRLWAKRN